MQPTRCLQKVGYFVNVVCTITAVRYHTEASQKKPTSFGPLHHYQVFQKWYLHHSNNSTTKPRKKTLLPKPLITTGIDHALTTQSPQRAAFIYNVPQLICADTQHNSQRVMGGITAAPVSRLETVIPWTPISSPEVRPDMCEIPDKKRTLPPCMHMREWC